MIPVYDRIFSMFFPNNAGRLLDVGCGTGLYWPVLSQYAEQIIGVDYSESMINEARRLVRSKGISNIEARVQNGEDLDFPPDSFDTILCMDVLHHIPDIKRAIDNFSRVLKPGGHLLAVEPNTFNPLIFFAHLIPAEERRAIKRNYAPVLCNLFKIHFRNIQVTRINFIASAESEEQLKRVESIGRFISKIPILRNMSLRQALFMERRDKV
jgi:ubiquinone/menaquinone biosynthesis C-methylase UbiE